MFHLKFTQILVVLAAVLGTIIYRISIVSAIYSGTGGFFKKHAKIVTTITAATINLILIMILTRVYLLLTIFSHFLAVNVLKLVLTAFILSIC